MFRKLVLNTLNNAKTAVETTKITPLEVLKLSIPFYPRHKAYPDRLIEDVTGFVKDNYKLTDEEKNRLSKHLNELSNTIHYAPFTVNGKTYCSEIDTNKTIYSFIARPAVYLGISYMMIAGDFYPDVAITLSGGASIIAITSFANITMPISGELNKFLNELKTKKLLA